MYVKNLYNICTHNKIVVNEKNVIKKLKILLSIKWIIDGKGNSILINTGRIYKDVTIHIIGNNNKIKIEEGGWIERLELRIDGEKGMIKIGKNTTIEEAVIDASEGSKVVIGRECMISYGVDIRSNDGHGIYFLDNLQERINKSKNVLIGDHVWIGKNVQCLKGTVVRDNSIIGAGSLVTKKFKDANVIIVGRPAEIKQRGITWKR